MVWSWPAGIWPATSLTSLGQYGGGPFSKPVSDGTTAVRPARASWAATGCQLAGPSAGACARTKICAMAS